MDRAHLKLVLHVDGGARGNPGPAAIGVVLSDIDGELVNTFSARIGEASNNVAEYRALLRGLELATEHGAEEVRIINDSELVARQVSGVYKVKHPVMRDLHREVMAALQRFASWSIESVPRAQNAEADRLVNEALDR
jgi:ribonuclease HI